MPSSSEDAVRIDGVDLIKLILHLLTKPMEASLGRIPTCGEVRDFLAQDEVWQLVVNEDGPLAAYRGAANLAREEMLSALERLEVMWTKLGGIPERWSREVASRRRLHRRLAKSRETEL